MGFEQLLVELQDTFGDDRVIAESAWTSSYTLRSKDLRTSADVERVVRMLGGSKPAHGVPFESVVFRFWIRMPISTDRQFMTHRMQSANGMSGRYRTMPDDCYGLPEDVLDILANASTHNCLQHDEIIEQEFNELCEKANTFYRHRVAQAKDLLSIGKITEKDFKRLREIYRNVLPQGAMTERTSTMNLRSFANFQKQRNDKHAAPEIRTIAELMLEEVEKSGRIPVALEVLKENGWVV